MGQPNSTCSYYKSTQQRQPEPSCAKLYGHTLKTGGSNRLVCNLLQCALQIHTAALQSQNSPRSSPSCSFSNPRLNSDARGGAEPPPPPAAFDPHTSELHASFPLHNSSRMSSYLCIKNVSDVHKVTAKMRGLAWSRVTTPESHPGAFTRSLGLPKSSTR